MGGYARCFLCGKMGYMEYHHVYNGFLRKKSTEYGYLVPLCGDSCHRNGKNSVHQNAEIRNALKQHFQIKYMNEYHATVKDFIREFDKNRLEDDQYEDMEVYPVNTIAISGTICYEPKLNNNADSRKKSCVFTVAVQRPGCKEKMDYLKCIAWDKRADFVMQKFKRGDHVEVSGCLTSHAYEKDGQKRKETEIRADNIFFGNELKDKEAVDDYTAAKNISGYTNTFEITDEVELPFE